MTTSALNCTAQARVDTPLGPVTLAATERGLAGVWFDGQRHHPGALDAPIDPAQRWIAAAREQLAAYWRCSPSRIAPRFSLPLDPRGTVFQQRVWAALLEVAPGCTCSYSEIARRIGQPAAVRAVGAAVGRNPLSIIVPCHRIVGRDGSLTGYAGGLSRKRALLRLEGAACRRCPEDRHETT